jgi:hypothetical protein
VVPLVSQGELIGVINLGDRRSEQEYTSDDRKLLDDLTAQASPAVRVAQLVRQQRLEARERERIEQELKVARLIQQTLLPRDVPHLSGWDVAAYYQPAREVGGDFYDFLYFDDGRLGIIIGDVTDKGVPAALVMATTRTLLRVIGERLVTPGAVLERVNELLIDDIPPACSSPASTPAGPGQRPPAVRQRRPRPALPPQRRRRPRDARHRHAAGPAARHGLRGKGDHPGPRRHGLLLQRRPGRGAQPCGRDVRLPARAGAADRLPQPGRSDRLLAGQPG